MTTKRKQWEHKKEAKRGVMPHLFDCKIFHWSYCRSCGLILLNNDTSQKAAQKMCRND